MLELNIAYENSIIYRVDIWGEFMKKYYYRYKRKPIKIMGMILGLLGTLIIVTIVSIRILLLLIGIVLVVTGFLLLNESIK